VSNAVEILTFWECAARHWNAYPTAPMNHPYTQRGCAFGRINPLYRRCNLQNQSNPPNSSPPTANG